MPAAGHTRAAPTPSAAPTPPNTQRQPPVRERVVASIRKHLMLGGVQQGKQVSLMVRFVERLQAADELSLINRARWEWHACMYVCLYVCV